MERPDAAQEARLVSADPCRSGAGAHDVDRGKQLGGGDAGGEDRREHAEGQPAQASLQDEAHHENDEAAEDRGVAVAGEHHGRPAQGKRADPGPGPFAQEDLRGAEPDEGQRRHSPQVGDDVAQRDRVAGEREHHSGESGGRWFRAQPPGEQKLSERRDEVAEQQFPAERNGQRQDGVQPARRMEGALVELADEGLAQPFVGEPLRQLEMAQARPDVMAERSGRLDDVAVDRNMSSDQDRPEEERPRHEEENGRRREPDSGPAIRDHLRRSDVIRRV